MTAIIPAIGVIDHAAFNVLLATDLPEVAAEIDDDDRALLHLEMATVARCTCRAIENNDAQMVARYFDFIDRVLSTAASEVENAVYVSYLENVFLWDERSESLAARSKLPARLQVALKDLEAHWASLADASRKP